MNPQLELSDLLEAERGQRLTPQAIDAGWLRLEQALALPVTTAGLAAAPAKVGFSMLAKSFLATSAALVAANGVGLFDTPRASEPPAVTVAAAGRVPEPRLEPQSAAAAVPEVAPATTERDFSAKRESPVAPAAPQGAADASFDDELRLIGNAKRELDRGQRHLASIWLSEHASRYPAGAFASEREGLKILISCASPNAASRDSARRFAERYPASPLLDRIFRSCGAQDESPADAAKKAFEK